MRVWTWSVKADQEEVRPGEDEGDWEGPELATPHRHEVVDAAASRGPAVEAAE
jgi:hypothetical protein